MPEFAADRDRCPPARSAGTGRKSNAIAKVCDRDAVGHEFRKVDSLAIEFDPGTVDQLARECIKKDTGKRAGCLGTEERGLV